MKRLLLFLAALLPNLVLAGQLHALIIIDSNAPKPALDPAYAAHFETVLWPPTFEGEGSRMLTLMSGLDWTGERMDASFRPEGIQTFVAVNFNSLLRRGYFAKRSEWLRGMPVYALSGPAGAGTANPNSLLLGLGAGSDKVKPVPYHGPWPDVGLLVFEAETWAEAEDVADRVTGRALILQLPRKDAGTWDSFYRRGRDWPSAFGAELPLDSATGVTGLLPARDAVKLLLDPDAFEWRSTPDAKDVVWRWFPAVRAIGLAVLVLGMTFLACVIGFATYSVNLEERAPLAATLLVSSGLAPAFLLILGALERRFGLENWPTLLLLDAIFVGVALAGLQGILRRVFPGSQPLLAASVVGLLACVFCDPKWSLLSGLFGYENSPVSSEAIGALVAYLTSVVAFTRSSNLAAAWFGRAAVIAVLVVGCFGNGWWGHDRWVAALLPAVALVAGEGWMRWPFLFILALVPNGRSDVVRHGVAWSPLGCVADVRAVGAVNAFDYFAFATYPGLWALAIIGLYVGVFGGGFLSRQMKLIVRQDPRMKALPWAAAGVAAMGALNPVLLPAAVLVAFGALIAFFHAAVWTL